MPMSPDAYRRSVYVFQALKLGSVLLGLALLAAGRVSWLDAALLAVMYALTMLGITAGFHRLFAHHSFEARPVLSYPLAILGSMAGQGGVLIWAATHRKHHQHSDQPLDPHSPHAAEGSAWRRFWHAHTGWILAFYPQDLERYVPDLMKDRTLLTIHRMAAVWILAGLVLPALVGGLVGGWQAALTGMLWGGWVRMFLVEQGACLVNSAGHVWGRRPFTSRDKSTNSGLLAAITLGDGWHNGHHAFPASARHGLLWWELDLTYLLIRLWQALGLARQVVVPTAEQVAAKRAQSS